VVSILSIIVWLLLVISGVDILYAGLFALLGWMSNGLLTAHLRSEALRVNQHQLPELHATFEKVWTKRSADGARYLVYWLSDARRLMGPPPRRVTGVSEARSTEGWTGRRCVTAVAVKLTGSVLIPVLARLFVVLAMAGVAIATTKAWADQGFRAPDESASAAAGIEASEDFSRLGSIPAKRKTAQLKNTRPPPPN
jgi:hypothetical protein